MFPHTIFLTFFSRCVEDSSFDVWTPDTEVRKNLIFSKNIFLWFRGKIEYSGRI